MSSVRVLLVDDSAFMRQFVSDLLSDVGDINVIGTAKNGMEALRQIRKLSPEVVILDIEMPVLDGLKTLEIIMETHPLPVILFSGWNKQGANMTFQAMEKGAYDFIPKPVSNEPGEIERFKRELSQKIIAAKKANLNALTRHVGINFGMKPVILNHEQVPGNSLVLIGSSTGGPRSLETVIGNLPKNFPAPVIIVQHMPPRFTRLLAERLDRLGMITVKEAEDGEKIEKGVAYVAPGGYHLTLQKAGNDLVASLNQDAPRKGLRPAYDCLLESVTDLDDYRKIAVFLTGMGSDGAKGLIQLKKSKHVYAIAESEETAVIFGMPRAAIETGLVDEVARLEAIASLINKKVHLGWT